MRLYIHARDANLNQTLELTMQKPLVFMMSVAAVVLLVSGCAGPEKKFGRGLSNVTEVARLGELRRSIEQTAIFYSPQEGYTRGFMTGLNKTLARTGLGVYEIVTFPIPSYEPIWTNYLAANPVFPASYHPNLIAGPEFDTDTSVGFSGGDFAPFIPGSRFHIFAPIH